MIIYIVDRQLNVLGHASTNLPAGHGIVSDSTVEDVETGVNTFTCSIAYTKETRAQVESLVQVGRYVLKQRVGSDVYDSLYQIIETEYDTATQEVTLYAEDAGMDLLNKVCPAVTLTGNLQSMMQYFLPSDWVLNVISAPTNTYTYTWDGESTCTERLMSVVGIFDCELYYSFDIDGLTVTRKKVNVVKKRGSQTPIANLRLDYDINRIYTKTSIAELVTALTVTGGTPDGEETPINLIGYNYSYTDPVTRDVYQVDATTGQMRNTTAMKRWASALDSDGLWIGSFQFDTTDKAVLAGQARARLQQLSAVMVNYEVDLQVLPKDAKIGDRVTIIDNQGNLYLEARLLKIETSASANTQTATIGEYLLRDGGISEKVVALSSQLQNQIAVSKANQIQIETLTNAVDTMSTLEATSETFANYTTLYAHVYRGTEEITSQFDGGQFKWLNRNENGEEYLGRGYSITVDMDKIGYASTILLKFVRPTLYNLTDHNLIDITDQNLEPIQVAYAGIYTQPVLTRNALKMRKAPLRATVQSGIPNITREVNLYERGTRNATLQRFWVTESGDDAGAHITEIPQDEFEANPQGGNLLARSDGIALRDGLTEMATFRADAVQVGAEDSSHITMSDQSLIGHGSYGRTFFEMRDLRGTTQIYFDAGDGTTTVFNLLGSESAKESMSRVTVDGVETTDYTVSSPDGWFVVTFTTPPASGANIQFITVRTQFSPAFSFGTAGTNLVPYTLAVGEQCYALDDHCISMGYKSASNGNCSIAVGDTADAYGSRLLSEDGTAVALGDHVTAYGAMCSLGKYNTPSMSGGVTPNLLTIGNGTDEDHRSNALEVSPSGNLTIAGTLTQSSDKRLKEHIEYLGNEADEFIRELQPVHFRKDGADHLGFYAQDVREADKWNCVTGEMNGYLTLGYTELIAPLVAYCQNLEKRIAELEKK